VRPNELISGTWPIYIKEDDKQQSISDFSRNSQYVLYALWDVQPVKADECISDVVTASADTTDTE